MYGCKDKTSYMSERVDQRAVAFFCALLAEFGDTDCYMNRDEVSSFQGDDVMKKLHTEHDIKSEKRFIRNYRTKMDTRTLHVWKNPSKPDTLDNVPRLNRSSHGRQVPSMRIY